MSLHIQGLKLAIRYHGAFSRYYFKDIWKCSHFRKPLQLVFSSHEANLNRRLNFGRGFLKIKKSPTFIDGYTMKIHA